MAGPVAFDAGLDGDLAAIIGPWAAPVAKAKAVKAPAPAAKTAEPAARVATAATREKARERASAARLLPQLIASQRASTAVVAALSFALIAGTAFILRDRSPEVRRAPPEVARKRPEATGAVAERVERAADAEVATPAPVQPEDVRVAAAPVPAPTAAAVPAPARVAAPAPEAVRPKRAVRTAAVAAAPESVAEASPEPVRVAMVAPAAEPARPSRVEPPRPARVEAARAVPAPAMIVSGAGDAPEAAGTRRARKDGVDSLRGLRRQ